MYGTLEEASADLGVTVSGVSRGITESGRVKGVPIRRVDRVYAVKEKGGEWFVGVLNNRNSAYLGVAQTGKRVLVRDAEKVKEITVAWYLRAD